MNTADSRPTLLAALRDALGFDAHGEAVANLTLGRGSLDGRPVRVALVENRIASGSIGKAEVAKLVPLLGIVARERSPLLLYLDSAGARVSEGLDALGAFRRLFREALAARLAGAPVAIALGRNCYGGASMLAHVAGMRLFSPETQLAMSGPAILAQAAGTTALDEMFRAIAEATIGASARAKACDANAVWSREMDLAAWLRSALVAEAQPWAGLLARHEALRARLGKGLATRLPEAVRRKDLERLYRDGYQAAECDGVITGECSREGGPAPMLGLVGNSHLGAERAWRFAEAAWQHARNAPARLEVLLDCETHAAKLDDERIVLSEYIVDMGVALSVLAARGTHVALTVLDRAGGGVYVALAAPATRVATVHGADVQVLPGAAVASILGASRDAVGDIDEYRRAGVAEDEHKLGLFS